MHGPVPKYQKVGFMPNLHYFCNTHSAVIAIIPISLWRKLRITEIK